MIPQDVKDKIQILVLNDDIADANICGASPSGSYSTNSAFKWLIREPDIMSTCIESFGVWVLLKV